VKRAAGVFVDIGQFMDQVLLSMVSAHDLANQRGTFAMSHAAMDAGTIRDA
jgi:hypothetical protein